MAAERIEGEGMAQDMTMAPFPASRRFPSQRLSLHYVDWGNDGAPLLLLIHGGEDHARSWDWVAQQMRQDWHIVAVDLRGHGDSDWSPDGVYGLEYLVADLAALIGHLGEVPVAIIAHSFGGAIALRYAGLFPETVSKMVVIEGLAAVQSIARVNRPADEEERIGWRTWIERRAMIATATPRAYATLEEAAQRMQDRNPHLNAEQALHLARWGLRRRDTGDHVWKFDPYMRIFMPTDASDRARQPIWAAIRCPVLMIHGKDSWATNPAEDGRVAYFSNARVESFANAGHWVHHDRLVDFAAVAQAFLAGKCE